MAVPLVDSCASLVVVGTAAKRKTAGCSMQVRWRGRRDTGNDAGRNWDGFGLVVAAGGDILPAAGSWIETVQLDE